MKSKRNKIGFLVWVVSVCAALWGCVAKSGHELRFRESGALTAPSLNVSGVNDGKFSFVFVGDIHLAGTDTARLRTILQSAKDNNDAFIVFLGDLVDKGVRSDFETFKSAVADYGFQDKVIYVIGNHDIFEDGWTAYRELIGPTHYAITIGNSKFVVTDSADGAIGENQTQWIKEQLTASADVEHLFLLSHYMPFVSGQRTYLRLSNETEAVQLMKLMSRFGVRAWLGGHYHSYAMEEIDRVKYIVAGGGGGRRMEPIKDLFFVRAFVDGSHFNYEINRF